MIDGEKCRREADNKARQLRPFLMLFQAPIELLLPIGPCFSLAATICLIGQHGQKKPDQDRNHQTIEGKFTPEVGISD